MGVKVSIQVGAAVHLGHNRRVKSMCPDDGHIDWKRTKDNLTLRDENIRKVYSDTFGEAVSEYNDNQKDARRKIGDYYTKILNDKQKHPVYEMIVQVGSKDNPVDPETSKKILKDYYNKFLKENPNLKVTGAFIHVDEASPHMHLDFIPVAEYDKGLRKRNALNNAFEQQMGQKSKGPKQTAQIKWQENQRETLREISERYEIKTDEVEHGVRTKHLDTPQYKQVMKKAEEDLKKIQKKEQELLDKVNKKIELVEKKSAYDYISSINGQDRQWYRQQKIESEGIFGGGMQYKKVPVNMIKEFENWMAKESIFAQGQRVKTELQSVKSEISELMGMKPVELQMNEINQQKIKLEKENVKLKGQNSGLLRKNRQMSGFIEKNGLTKDFSRYVRKMNLKPLKGLGKVAGVPGQIADKTIGSIKIGVKAGIKMFNAFKSNEEKKMEAERMTSRVRKPKTH